MSSEQIEALARGIAQGSGGPEWWVYGLLMLAAGVASFVGAYLAEKGKNLASKEDVSKITEQVEAVKRQHQEVIEKIKGLQEVRMLAGERRLEAHQKAFALWRQMMTCVHGDAETRTELVLECQTFHFNNCLYLEAETRQNFAEAYVALAGHPQLIEARATADMIKENFGVMRRLGDVIMKEMKLPPLSEAEQSKSISENPQ